jgi:Ca2+:H+ antiporter
LTSILVAQTAASLLALAIGSLIIPTVYNQIVPLGRNGDTNENDGTLTSIDKQTRISEMSHGTSLLLLLVYGCYLYFQLSTHAAMYNEPSKKAERRKPKKAEKGDAIKSMIKSGAVGAQAGAQEDQRQSVSHKNEDEEEVPKLSITTAVITLVGSTVLVAFNAEYMTESIKKITESGALSPEFVGLILLPIVGNAAEHATAVTVSVKDKMDLAIGVAVGSSMQVWELWSARTCSKTNSSRLHFWFFRLLSPSAG